MRRCRAVDFVCMCGYMLVCVQRETSANLVKRQLWGAGRAPQSGSDGDAGGGVGRGDGRRRAGLRASQLVVDSCRQHVLLAAGLACGAFPGVANLKPDWQAVLAQGAASPGIVLSIKSPSTRGPPQIPSKTSGPIPIAPDCCCVACEDPVLKPPRQLVACARPVARLPPPASALLPRARRNLLSLRPSSPFALLLDTHISTHVLTAGPHCRLPKRIPAS